MECTKGTLQILQNRFPLEFGRERGSTPHACLEGSSTWAVDEWECFNCQQSNYSRRECCRRCSSRRAPGASTASVDAQSTNGALHAAVDETLRLCPELEWLDTYYTDRSRVWIFDPISLYWFNSARKVHYRMICEQPGQQMLVRVDSESGVFVTSRNEGDLVPLPAQRLQSVVTTSVDIHPKDTPSAQPMGTLPSSTPTSIPIPGPVTVASQATVCLLCQRKFNTLELLRKHENFSKLHQANLQDS